MQKWFLTRCEWGQHLALHPITCYMDGAVFVQGDLGTGSENQRQEWALCQPQAELSPEHGMAAAAEKMAALCKVLCHRNHYDKREIMFLREVGRLNCVKKYGMVVYKLLPFTELLRLFYFYFAPEPLLSLSTLR